MDAHQPPGDNDTRYSTVQHDTTHINEIHTVKPRYNTVQQIYTDEPQNIHTLYTIQHCITRYNTQTRNSHYQTIRQFNRQEEKQALEAESKKHWRDKEGSRYLWVASDCQPTHPTFGSAYSGHARTPTTVTVTVLVSRLHNYYVFNIMVPMFVLTFIGMSTIAIPICDVSQRLSVNLTLLLTAVAYKFIVSQDLPHVAYLTFLDIFVLLCLGTLVLYIIENVIVGMIAMQFCQGVESDAFVDFIVPQNDNATDQQLQAIKEFEQWLDRFSFFFACTIAATFCLIVFISTMFAAKKRTKTRAAFVKELEEPFNTYEKEIQKLEVRIRSCCAVSLLYSLTHSLT